jgi:hypothetical protein
LSIPILGAYAAAPTDSSQVGLTPLAEPDVHDSLAHNARDTTSARTVKVLLVSAGPGVRDRLARGIRGAT